MSRHIPSNTAVRFLWHESDGTLRTGVGTTRDISQHGVFVLANDVPSPGAAIQMIVDVPSVPGATEAGRLMGRGVAVRVEQDGERPQGFAAEVLFQPGVASLFPPAETTSLYREGLDLPSPVYWDDFVSASTVDSEADQWIEMPNAIANSATRPQVMLPFAAMGGSLMGESAGPVADVSRKESPSAIPNRKAARLYLVVALLVLMFAGRISSPSEGRNHWTILDMDRAPYETKTSVW